jgi:drug/metabolite transporter (DMT)-like permease
MNRAPMSGNVRSILAMLVAMLFFALMDAVLKQLTAHYPVMQIAALRGLTALPLVFVYIALRQRWHTVWRIRWPLHLVRGVMGVAMIALFTAAVRDLPLSAAYTLFFIAPLLIALLSTPVLGERVARAHWWAIAGGFAGVLIALQPQHAGGDFWAQPMSGGGAAALGAAACYAVAAVSGRLASRSDSAESLVLWMMVFMGVGAGLLAWPDWVPLRAEHTALLLGLAVTGFIGQLAITEAFRHGQASAVAPFEYSALAWGAGLDWLIWQSLPGATVWMGAGVVIASGLFLLRHENRLAKTEVEAGRDRP